MTSSSHPLPVSDNDRTQQDDPSRADEPPGMDPQEATFLGEPDPPAVPFDVLTAEYARLVEELCAEQAVLWDRGQGPFAETFFREHPHLIEAPVAFALVRGEIGLRRARGEAPALGEYLERFPEFAGQLLAHFAPEEARTAEVPSKENRSVTGVVTPRLFPERPPQAWPLVPGYEVLGELGRGGMGVVYKARQVGLNRVVALKMIHHEAFGDLEFLARFHGEAEAIARLQHPHIVQIFGLGTIDRPPLPQPYFSLEFVEGGDLRDRLADHPLHPNEAARLLLPLAQAVHYAHERGIVHRDLKPANVLLTAEGQPKITDFGVAKVETEAGADPGLTQRGVVLGTPAYMAPEQTTGKEEVGAGADVYALGVMLYEMLTGRCPFEGLTPPDTMELARTQEPIPPRRLQPKIPRPLETICLKCLGKEPRFRYLTAQELADDLGRYLAGEPIRARPAGPLERGWRWACRRPLVAALLGLVVLLTLAGASGVSGALWYALAGWREAEANAREAGKERRRAEEEERKAKDARALAERGEEEAKTERRRAEEQREGAEKNLYFSRIAQARLERQVLNVIGSERALDLCLPDPGGIDRRGWEWHYLKRLNHADLFTRRIPEAQAVGDIAFSPDGRLLAVGSGNPYARQSPGGVTVWDQASGETLFRLEHARGAYRLAISPDGRWLATGDAAGQLLVSEMATGRERFALTSPSGGIQGLDFSPDSARLFVLSGQGRVDVYDPTEKKRIASPCDFARRAVNLRLSPDGKVLAILFQNAVSLIDSQTGKELRQLPNGSSAADQIAFSPDGQYLLTADEDKGVLWAAGTGQRVRTFQGHQGKILGLAFSPDGEHVATGGADRTVRIWDVWTGNEQLILRGHVGRVKAIAFHPEGHLLASGSCQPVDVNVWDVTRPQRLSSIPTNPLRTQSVARLWWAEGMRFSLDSQRILLAGRNGMVATADPETGLLEGVGGVPMLGDWMVPANLATFTPDGTAVVAPDREDGRTVGLWDLPSGKRRQSFRHRVPVHSVSFSGNGRRLATVGLGNWEGRPLREITVWEVATGNRMLVAEGAGPPGFQALSGVAALSPDGGRLAFDETVVAAKGRGNPNALGIGVRVVDVETGALVGRFLGHAADLVSLAFSPDGRYLASGDLGGQVMVWDLKERQNLYKDFLNLRGSATGLAFHPNGRRLAGVSREQVHLWEVSTGQELLILRGAGHRSRDSGYNPKVAWSPDGTRLASLNWDKSLSIWDASVLSGEEDRKRRRRAAEAHAFVWHLEQADRHPPGSAARTFHENALMKRTPSTGYQRILRGRYLARVGRLREAAEEYRLAFAADPPTHPDLWQEHALLCLGVGDQAEYEKLCQEIRTRFGNNNHPWIRARLVWVAALGTPTGIPPRQLTRLSNKIDPHNPRMEPEFCPIVGLAALRRGDLEGAWKALTRPPRPEGTLEEILGPDSHSAVCLWLVRALVRHRQGRSEEAKAWLTKAEGWVKEQQGQANAPLYQEDTWWQRLSIQILLNEAQSTLEE